MSRKMPRAMLPLWRCKSTSFLSSEVNMSELLIYDIALLLDLIGNSEGTKLLILTVIFCLVFTAPANWRVELESAIIVTDALLSFSKILSKTTHSVGIISRIPRPSLS